MNERGDDGELLLHPVRIRGDHIAQIGRKLKSITVFLDEPLTVCLGYAKEIADEIQVLNAGKMIVQIGIIRNIGKFRLAG